MFLAFLIGFFAGVIFEYLFYKGYLKKWGGETVAKLHALHQKKAAPK